MQYLKTTGTETVQFWVQFYKKDFGWKDIWQHESFNEAQKSFNRISNSYPDEEYRIVKRQINEEIC